MGDLTTAPRASSPRPTPRVTAPPLTTALVIKQLVRKGLGHVTHHSVIALNLSRMKVFIWYASQVRRFVLVLEVNRSFVHWASEADLVTARMTAVDWLLTPPVDLMAVWQ